MAEDVAPTNQSGPMRTDLLTARNIVAAVIVFGLEAEGLPAAHV
jgi:hypothetical protein